MKPFNFTLQNTLKPPFEETDNQEKRSVKTTCHRVISQAGGWTIMVLSTQLRRLLDNYNYLVTLQPGYIRIYN